MEIYRAENEDWILEVVDEQGNSTVWDDLFPTDQAALDEAMRTIDEQGIDAVIGPPPGKDKRNPTMHGLSDAELCDLDDFLADESIESTSMDLAMLDGYRPALDRADVLLNDLRIAEFAYLSDVLPSGLDQRMRAFAASLNSHAQKPTRANMEAVEQAADHALAHVLAATEPHRADRIEMARRIARWLLRPAPPATTVSGFLCWQAEEGAFIDWARFRLLGGDELAEVSHAYEAIRRSVIDRRNALGRQFAVALQSWNKQAPVHDDRIVPLESVLDRVVAPLAAHHPVLLLVADGLSISIFRELFARVDRFGWTELVPASTGKPMVGVAVVPTVADVAQCRHHWPEVLLRHYRRPSGIDGQDAPGAGATHASRDSEP